RFRRTLPAGAVPSERRPPPGRADPSAIYPARAPGGPETSCGPSPCRPPRPSTGCLPARLRRTAPTTPPWACPYGAPFARGRTTLRQNPQNLQRQLPAWASSGATAGRAAAATKADSGHHRDCRRGGREGPGPANRGAPAVGIPSCRWPGGPARCLSFWGVGSCGSSSWDVRPCCLSSWKFSHRFTLEGVVDGNVWQH
ncbi:hypothetical protein BDY21DRAFT_382367, partial [Lineolata rhizophorae]